MKTSLILKASLGFCRGRYNFLGIVFFTSFSVISWGQVKAPQVKATKADQSWEWINGFTYRDKIESQVNIYNRVLEIEKFNLRSDLIYTLKANYLDRWRFYFVPRFTLWGKQTQYSNYPSPLQVGYGKLDLLEANADYTISPESNFVVGLQNYQWGPAEFFSPSHGFLHFSFGQKSILWRDKGKVLARVNLGIGKSWTAVLMNEFMSNGMPEWIYNQAFASKSLVKFEYRSGSVSNRYLGFVGGNQENYQSFVGTYGNYSITDAVSLYLDARMVSDPKAYYAQYTLPNYNMTLGYKDGRRGDQVTAIAGLRYESEKVDLRLEYFSQSLGYTAIQFRHALASGNVFNPNLYSNLMKLQFSGLELPGREYYYLSMRINNPFKDQSQGLSFRYFLSAMDGSGTLQLNWEKGFGDRWTFYLEGTVNTGSDNSELVLLDHGTVFLGAKAVF